MIKGKFTMIRAMEESDLVLVHSWNFDSDTTKFFSPRLPGNMLEQRKWFEAQHSRQDKKKMMILDIATGDPIGMIGLMNIDHLNKNCEIGITIGNPTYRGKEHSLDALRTLLEFMFREFNMHLVYLTVFKDNTRAVSFFRKAGFSENGVLREFIYKSGKYHDMLWMSVTRSEFDKNDQ